MSRWRHRIPHLFDHWDYATRLIRGSGQVALLLDFDGTLVKIAARPDRVRLPVRTQRVLRRLTRMRGVTLAVVSGRRSAELQRHIGVQQVEYLGLYGWEHDGEPPLSSPVQVALFRTQANLLGELASYPGVWIEPKQHSFSVHLLGTSVEIQRRVRRRVRALLAPWHEKLRVFDNLRDVEVAAASIQDKGAAVRRFLGKPERRSALPVYFGDDLSDESAFVAARKGLSILVGRKRATRARFCLRGPAEVTIALERIEALLR